VSAATVAAQIEHCVALGEQPDLRADRIDLAGELAAKNRVPGSSEPGEAPNEDRVGLPHTAVRAVDGRGVDLDEQLIGFRDGLCDPASATTSGGPYLA
jgi:hypothetical protein